MNYKKKTKLAVMISIMTAVLLSAGGVTMGAYAAKKAAPVKQDTSAYIGLDAAKKAALAHAGVQEGGTHYCNCWLEYESKAPAYYKVEFAAGNISYKYEIDLYTGEVLNYKTVQLDYSYPPTSAGSTDSDGSNASGSITDIGQDAAKQAAFTHAGISETQVSKLKIKQDRKDGRLQYKVEFKCGKEKYKYTIDAATGNILKIG